VLRGPENRGAVGAEFETPKASSGEGNGEGVSSLPSRLEVLGERRKLPQRSPGAEPRPKTDFFVHFELEKRIW